MADISFDFAGRSVLVTGASRGIGYGIAAAFAQAGAEVTILADDEAVFQAAARLTTCHGRPVVALQCDITDAEAVRKALGEIETIDVLINNAGLERVTPVTDADPQVETTFRRITDINVNGSFVMTREALAKMRKGARIIFTSSVWGRTAVGEFSAYVASKHATLGLMRSLARELGPAGINVNAVCPGWVRTDASMLSLKRMAERSGRAESELLDEIVAQQIIPGLMEPADVAPAYLFLASEAAASITGQAIEVDRGEFMA